MGGHKFSTPAFNEVGSPGSDGVVWVDEKYPLHGRRIYTAAGHLDYNATELGIDFDDSSRYNDDDQIGIIAQMNHNYKTGTNLRPHLHWMQNQNATPNWLLKYRAYDNGDSVPSWSLAGWSENILTYSSGTILQITRWPEIDMSSITGLSAFVDIKIYRDVANASTELAGADPYTGDALAKEFDNHYQKDMGGSREELSK